MQTYTGTHTHKHKDWDRDRVCAEVTTREVEHGH